MKLGQTPSQTVGPFFHYGLVDNGDEHILVNDSTRGGRILLKGQVTDGNGDPVTDAMLEIWQADANGVYPSQADTQGKTADPHFQGWGRTGANFETGFWRFNTVKPGAVAGRKGSIQAPHIAVAVFARGINIGLHTRVYFEDEVDANANDPVLNSIEWAVRHQTLIAKRSEVEGEVVYRFDIRIQGDDETVFFDI